MTTLDPTIAALLGAVIGGVIGVIGTIITVWSAARRERSAHLRVQSVQHRDRVIECYEFALNVFFNLNRDGSPDRGTYGQMYAKLSLHGSAEVNKMLSDYLSKSKESKYIDIEALTIEMKKHVKKLQ